jgi:general secretion pathway protein J
MAIHRRQHYDFSPSSSALCIACKRPASGFTLLEMLVVTGLMALLVLLGLNLMRSSAASSSKSEAAAQRNEQLRNAQSFVRRQITGALPIAYEFDASNGEAKFFSGERDKLQFVANMPGYLSYGGAYMQTFELKHSGQNYRLEFQFQQITSEGLLKPERKPEVLLEGIKNGEFSYRALDEQSKPGSWKNSWDTPTQIPLQTSLKIEFLDKKMHWPLLVTASKLSAATATGGNPGLRPTPYSGDPEFGDEQ